MRFDTQFFRFCFAGGVAALANIFSRMVLEEMFSHFMYVDSLFLFVTVVISYMIGMVTAFFLCRLLVFSNESTNKTGHQVFYFTLINLAALCQILLTTFLLNYWLRSYLVNDQLRHTCVHAISVFVPVFTSYFGHKYITFRVPVS